MREHCGPDPLLKSRRPPGLPERRSNSLWGSAGDRGCSGETGWGRATKRRAVVEVVIERRTEPSYPLGCESPTWSLFHERSQPEVSFSRILWWGNPLQRERGTGTVDYVRCVLGMHRL